MMAAEDKTGLNSQQRAAVERTGQDVCVVAGPGSGKTRVLTERFGWLVETQAVEPERILAITFTEKAAGEIKDRLVTRFERTGELRRRIERAWVSTIHGFCARVIREHAIAAGVDVNFTVLDDTQAPLLLREVAEVTLDRLLADEPGKARRLIETVDVASAPSDYQEDLAGALISLYEAVRVAGAGLDRSPSPSSGQLGLAAVAHVVRSLVDQGREWKTARQRARRDEFCEWLMSADALAGTKPCLDHFRTLNALNTGRLGVPEALKDSVLQLSKRVVPDVRAQLLAEYYGELHPVLTGAARSLDRAYRQRKRALSALDFADLEEHALRLFDGRPGVLESVRGQFDYILMDEVQDTNPLQWEIVNRIRRADSFFAVGDINQSIYGFRHAEPELFQSYRTSLEDKGKRIDTLEENYRSRQEILDAVAWLVEDCPGIEPRKLSAGTEHLSKPEPAVEVLVALADTAAEARAMEARCIASRVSQFVADGVPLRDIGILTRKVASLEPIAQALRETGVPCYITGGRTLFEGREVRDVVHLLNALANVHDERSLAGVLRSPLVGLRDETLLRLKLLRRGLWAGLTEAAEHPPAGIDEADREHIGWFIPLARELRAARDSVSPDRLLARVLDESGYLERLDGQALANIDRFLSLVREKGQSGAALAEVAEHVARLRQRAPQSEAPPADASNSVRLMSIHSAKGLEFQVVFVASLQSRTSNDLPAICYSPQHFIGVRWLDPLTGKGAGDIGYRAVEDSLRRKNEAEEWRLLYVAMTRAEDHLVLSWSATPRSQGSLWTKHLRKRFQMCSVDLREGTQEIAVPGSVGRMRITATGRAPQGAVASRVLMTDSSPVTLGRPVISGQHDSSVPVAWLSEFALCPRKYYLARYLGFESSRPRAVWDQDGDESDPYDEPVEAGAAEIGTQVHRLLAGSDVKDPYPDARRLAAEFRRTDLARRMARAVRLEREFDFLMTVEETLLSGQIDAWFEEDGRLVVVDYKTDDFDPDREPERLAPYELQLRFYALALQGLKGRLPVQALLHFLRCGKTVPVSLDPASLEKARETVPRLRVAQDRLQFPLREGVHCRRCSFYRGLCPAGKGG